MTLLRDLSHFQQLDAVSETIAKQQYRFSSTVASGLASAYQPCHYNRMRFVSGAACNIVRNGCQSVQPCNDGLPILVHLQQDDNKSEEEEDEPPAGIVSFVPQSANKYPKAKKPRTSTDKDSSSSKPERDKAKVPQAARTLVKAGELVHVATDVPLSAQHDMFGAVDTSSFQVGLSRPR